MSDSVIRVENLCKCYTINRAANDSQRSGDGLRHALQDALAKPFRAFQQKVGGQRLDRSNPSSYLRPSISEDFYALQNVSFEVKRGEVLGIIGRNGAGKSTLLKILSRITEPTKGRIGIKGRVASLLEVGTGFHAELTGRENIYLNGAILGMSHAEVRSKFDEIVDFSGVEKFLDTPVKRYSSGMYVRLAFAVAAHLSSEILIVDEVLAVGDSEFQKKCLGRMQDLASTHGRTVILVSHDLAAIQRLCNIGLHFADGRIVQSGPIDRVAAGYLQRSTHSVCEPVRPISPGLYLINAEVTPQKVVAGNTLDLSFTFEARQQIFIEQIVPLFYNNLGQRIAILDLPGKLWVETLLTPGKWCLRAQIHAIPFVEGEYNIGFFYQDKHRSSDYLDLAHFFVIHAETDENRQVVRPSSRGCVEVAFDWTLQKQDRSRAAVL